MEKFAERQNQDEQEIVDQLILNPSAEIGFGFRVVTRDTGPRQVLLYAKHHPELCRLLASFATEEWQPERLKEIPSTMLKQLIDYGILIRQQDAPDEVLFQCILDASLMELLPYRSRYKWSEEIKNDNLVINNRLRVQLNTEFPADVAERIPKQSDFLAAPPILWVKDPGTRVLSPYWFKFDHLDLMRRLLTGNQSPRDLSAHFLSMLNLAGILVPDGYQETRLMEWQERVQQLQQDISQQQYAILRGIIPPLQLAALRRHLRRLDQADYPTRDPEIGRAVMENENVTHFIHHQINDLINRVTQEPIKPSYTLLCFYSDGASLPRHIDRAQCVWNVSLLIDTEPETDLDSSWPIYLEVNGEPREVRLEMGDAVLYRGAETPHWRDALPDGQKATLIFCHFVPVDFKGSLNPI